MEVALSSNLSSLVALPKALCPARIAFLAETARLVCSSRETLLAGVGALFFTDFLLEAETALLFRISRETRLAGVGALFFVDFFTVFFLGVGAAFFVVFVALQQLLIVYLLNNTIYVY